LLGKRREEEEEKKKKRGEKVKIQTT